jgi:hypothetical protein
MIENNGTNGDQSVIVVLSSYKYMNGWIVEKIKYKMTEDKDSLQSFCDH